MNAGLITAITSLVVAIGGVLGLILHKGNANAHPNTSSNSEQSKP